MVTNTRGLVFVLCVNSDPMDLHLLSASLRWCLCVEVQSPTCSSLRILELIFPLIFQCQATNEEEIFEFQDKGSLLPLGWIHVSPALGFVNAIFLTKSINYLCLFRLKVSISIFLCCIVYLYLYLY